MTWVDWTAIGSIGVYDGAVSSVDGRILLS